MELQQSYATMRPELGMPRIEWGLHMTKRPDKEDI
jgi:hypothetical protein